MTEEIGRHKGAVETLMHEKKELSRLLQIVNSQLKRHLSSLEEQGVDTDQFIEELQQGQQERQQQAQQRQKQETQQKNRRQQEDKQETVSDEDASDLLENGSDSGSRDFNPNR